ncbi:MAG: hypothetical protein ISS31_09990 [Kiritimatiellae bacterium]|nr:hypothetical protein [Kiritimatiellia bacterium]
MKALLHSKFTWLSVIVVALCATVVLAALLDDTKVENIFNHDLYKALMSREVDSVSDIVEDFEWQQCMFLPVAVPDPDFIHVQSGGLLPMDPARFPDAFVKGLVADKKSSITMYPITVYEDPITRERVILNAEEKKIGGEYASWDYDPLWYVKERYPAFSWTAVDSSDWLVSLYDPSRIRVTYKLILEDDLIKYVWAQSIAAAQAEELGGGMMKSSWEGGSVTNLKFVAADRDSNNCINVTLAYPESYQTNYPSMAFEIFTCDGGNGLIDFWWDLGVVTNIDTSTNWVEWTDTETSNAYVDVRFYVAAATNDADSDGFTDGYEKYVSHTSETNSDSYPVSVSGTISYTGSLTGPVRMIAVTESNSWVGPMATIASPGVYTNDKVANSTSYWFKAYRDINTNKCQECGEPWGIYSNASVLVTNDLTGVDIAMVLYDDDEDGLLDCWEMIYFGDLDESGEDDTDGDGVTNSDEYDLSTDPSDPNDPANIKGSVSYSTEHGGIGQTGAIYVVAVTSSSDWSTNISDTIADVGTYHITQVPHGDYWVKAWRDSDGNGSRGTYEATAMYSTVSIVVSNQVTGINLTMTDPDTDADGMGDWWEDDYFDSTIPGAAGDYDEDNLSNLLEYLTGTDPTAGFVDTDGDGMGDDWEDAYGLDKNDPDDIIGDPDGDLLPNYYEWHYYLQPTVADASDVPRLRVDLTGVVPGSYTTIAAAFAASSSNSIIELGPGHYTGAGNTDLVLPSHPVMITSAQLGAERSAILYTGTARALHVDGGHDNRTVIRGLKIVSSGGPSMSAGMWIGSGYAPYSGAAPFLDGITFVEGEQSVTAFKCGIYAIAYTQDRLVLNNCHFRGVPDGDRFYGIIHTDGPNTLLRNCTFSHMGTNSIAVFPQFSSWNAGGVPGTNYLTADASLWDSSFSATNAWPVAVLEISGKECSATFSNSVLPYLPPAAYAPDVTNGLIMTNVEVLALGHLASSNSPCIDASTTELLSLYDFETRSRDSLPDIGADEYAAFGSEDADGDGLSDLLEQTWGTGMHDPDTDRDGSPDGHEVACGTSPTNADDYCIAVLGAVSNETTYGDEVALAASYSFTFGEWDTNNAVTVSNGTFLLEHVTVSNNAAWWVQLHCDLNTNGVWDSFDALLQEQVAVIGATNGVVMTMDQDSVVDRDGDGMADSWESTYGLSWSNALDVFEDGDGDGLDNGWEYDLDLNPTVVNTGYAHSAVALAIDERIDGLNPSTALPILSTQDHVNTNYVRNTNCWAADLDLTCASPWNSNAANKKAGTLISPRHLVFANHASYFVPVGGTLRFVDSTNGVVTRTVAGLRRIGSSDLVVGILDSDAPTNRISHASVLPHDFRNYLGDGARLPVIRFDQEEKALVGNVRSLEPVQNSYGQLVFVDIPIAGTRTNFSETLIPGDSGNPCLMMVDETPVLLATWTFANAGPSITEYRSEVNDAMEALSNEQGVTNGYQLTTINLSDYVAIDDAVWPQGTGDDITVSVTEEESGDFSVYVVSISE